MTIINHQYYKLVDDDNNSVLEVLDFIDIKKTREYKGISMVKLTDSKFNIISKSKLIFEGKRIVSNNPKSTYTIPKYIERGFIQDNDGDMVEFTGVYADPGKTFITEVDFVDYLIVGTSGKIFFQ